MIQFCCRYNFDTEHPTLLDIESVDSVTTTIKDEKRVAGNGNGNPATASEKNSQNIIHEPPQFGLRWKIFELDGCEGAGKACLVFPPKSEGTQVVYH